MIICFLLTLYFLFFFSGQKIYVIISKKIKNNMYSPTTPGIFIKRHIVTPQHIYTASVHLLNDSYRRK